MIHFFSGVDFVGYSFEILRRLQLSNRWLEGRRRAEKKMSPEDRLVLEAPQTPAEAGLLLCGCPSACNDKPELTRQASRWITVAGKSVNHRDMPEDDLAEAILNAVDDIKK
jgi:ribosomal protein S7